MKTLKELKDRLKWLKVLLIAIPFIYALAIKLCKICIKKPKVAIITVTIIALLSGLFIISDIFKTKREIQKIQSIRLIIEPAR